MIPEAEALHTNLLERMDELSTEKDVLVRTRRIVGLILDSLLTLKELIRLKGFTDETEEIRFYKFIKPKFHALYIYHASLYTIEADKPLGSKKLALRYLRDEQRRIDNFFYHHSDLYKYYRSGETHLDREYFTRGHGFAGFHIEIVTPVIDEQYCTVHSIKIAILLAFQQLKDYLQQAKLQLIDPTATPPPTQVREPLTWTDTKVGLIELAYALHAAGALNNGKATLKQTLDHLQTSFHVELGNTSRTFQAILARKKGDTAYLDRLKSALLKRIEDFPNS